MFLRSLYILLDIVKFFGVALLLRALGLVGLFIGVLFGGCELMLARFAFYKSPEQELNLSRS